MINGSVQGISAQGIMAKWRFIFFQNGKKFSGFFNILVAKTL